MPPFCSFCHIKSYQTGVFQLLRHYRVKKIFGKYRSRERRISVGDRAGIDKGLIVNLRGIVSLISFLEFTSSPGDVIEGVGSSGLEMGEIDSSSLLLPPKNPFILSEYDCKGCS